MAKSSNALSQILVQLSGAGHRKPGFKDEEMKKI
jgi:hypothetical protein